MPVTYQLPIKLPPSPYGSALVDRLRVALLAVPHGRVVLNAAARTFLCLDCVLQRAILVPLSSPNVHQVSPTIAVPSDRPRPFTMGTPSTAFSAAQWCLDTITHLRDAAIAAAWFPRAFSMTEFLDILDEIDAWHDRENRMRHDRPFRHQLSKQFAEKFDLWTSGLTEPWQCSWQIISTFFAWELTHMLRHVQSAGTTYLGHIRIRSLAPPQTYIIGDVEKATVTQLILSTAERIVAVLNAAGFDNKDNLVCADDMVAGWRAILKDVLPYLSIVDEDGSLQRLERYMALIDQEEQANGIEDDFPEEQNDAANKQPEIQQINSLAHLQHLHRQGGKLPSLKPPSKDAMAVYRYQLVTGKTQVQMAGDMDLMGQLGRTVAQGTISRWLRTVEEWIKAGNVLPNLPTPASAKPTPMNPERIGLGKRRDGRVQRQRERRSDDDAD